MNVFIQDTNIKNATLLVFTLGAVSSVMNLFTVIILCLELMKQIVCAGVKFGV